MTTTRSEIIPRIPCQKILREDHQESRLKDLATRKGCTTALEAHKEKRVTPLSTDGKTKKTPKSSKLSKKKPGSETSRPKGTPLTSHIDCQGHPAEDFSHLYNELQDLKRRYPRWGKEHAELYFGAVRGIPTFLDQRRSDALMQDALLRLDSIAGSKKDVQMFIAHWKAAAPLAQRLTSQRQFDLHYYLTLPVGRA